MKFWPEALSLRSMRGRIALLLGLAMLPAGAIAMQVGFNAAAARQDAYQETLSRRALESIAGERRTIDELREMLRVLAATPALQQIEGGDCRDWLSEISARYPYIAAISVSTDDGRVLCSVPTTTPNRQLPDSDIRRRARARDSFTMGYTEHGLLSGRSVLGALEPVRDGDRRIGFVGASIPTTELTALLERSRNANNSLQNARAAILDSHGRIVAESSPEGRAPPLPDVQQMTRRFGGEPVFIKVEGGDAVIVPLYAPDIYAVMSWAPEQPLWRRVVELGLSIAAPLLIWLLAIGAGWFAIEVFVARPLSSLEAAARSFARGEDVGDPPALLSAPSEIRSLRRTLAAMAKTLRGRELRLVEALAEERALLREVHHRVKNNLQMVASLLNIQARAASDESESWGLARAHDRVQLLAVVHQRIYSSGELRDVRVDDIAAEVARQLLQSRGVSAKDINLVMELGAARAGVDRAVPLSFLIGEGVSAALDALSDIGPVEVRLSLQQDDNGSTRFAIDADIDAERARTPGPGARLIDAFARQLNATIGRDAQRPYMLWAIVPPEPKADSAS
ncbi:MAG: histidine kinase dimerization/phosphoacceptor domain -containing protein [Hyphomonadaceae bacterium]